MRHAVAMKHRSLLTLPLIGILLVTTGCAQDQPEPPATSRPTVAPTVAPPTIDAPTPLIDLACEDIIGTPALAALSTTPLTSFGSAYRIPGSARYGIPQEYLLRHLQGTICNWNNGVAGDIDGASNAFTSVTIYLLPNATPAWDNYVRLYGDYALEPPACNGADQVNARCWWTGMTADATWVDVTFDGMKNSGTDAANVEQFTPLLDAIIAAATDAPRGEIWPVPASGTVVPLGCPSVVSAEAIGTAVGASPADVKFNAGPIGGTSILFEVETLLGADDCRWNTSQTVSEYGNPYSILRGGQWAWEESRENDQDISAAQPLDLTGLGSGDSAWISHRSGTFVDLILHGDWITISVFENDLAVYGVGDEAVISLAQSVVDAA